MTRWVRIGAFEPDKTPHRDGEVREYPGGRVVVFVLEDGAIVAYEEVRT